MDEYCDSQYCPRDYGQERDSEGIWWCGDCGYQTYEWD